MIRKPLEDWINHQYQKDLRSVIVWGSILTFILCIGSGYLIQVENNASVVSAFKSSIRNWVQSGDFLQLKQVIGQLIDSKTINFAIVSDSAGATMLTNNPFEIGWSGHESTLNFSHGSVFRVSCSSYLIEGEAGPGVFCFGKRLAIGWFLFLAVSFVSVFSSLFILITKQSRTLSNILARQLIIVSEHIKKPDEKIVNEIEIQEVHDTLSEIQTFSDREKSSNAKLQELLTAERVALVAAQLAHDIRSPLAVLELVSTSLTEIPEQSRNMIRNALTRIKDIANTLTIKEKTKLGAQSFEVVNGVREIERIDATLLSPIIEQIISEKRLEWGKVKDFNIEFKMDKESYGLFGMVRLSEFNRVLSNVLNNAFEALPIKSGIIVIKTMVRDSVVEIQINDNGQGIEPAILARIGEKGNTYGKPSGSGLGLYHAKCTLKSWGGCIEVQSEVGRGTSVSLFVKAAAAPDWFVSKLKVQAGTSIVVFDDDSSIHQVWEGRFASAGAKNFNVKIQHISSTEMFRKYFRDNFAELDKAIFLVDFEILGSNENGLDLIEILGIQEQSILVTSRYEEVQIREKCKNLKVSLIPKPLSVYIPIEFL